MAWKGVPVISVTRRTPRDVKADAVRSERGIRWGRHALSVLVLLSLSSFGGYLFSLHKHSSLPSWHPQEDRQIIEEGLQSRCSQSEPSNASSIKLQEAEGRGIEGNARAGSKEETDQKRFMQRNGQSGPRIIGSGIQTVEEVLLFRGRWDCITSHHGSWVLNPTPRPIPVRDEVQEVPKNQICRRQINNSALLPINTRIREGQVSAADWKVPTSLKYEWKVVPAGSCGIPTSPWADVEGGLKPFDGRDLCRSFDSLRKRQGLEDNQPLEVFVVGDSLSAAFMSSWEAQMKLSMGPKGAVQVAPEGICANYTRNVKMLHPQYSNADEQWYEHGHYLWHGTHCAALQMCHMANTEWPDATEDDSSTSSNSSSSPGVMVRFGRTMHLSWLTASKEAEKLFLEEPWEKLPYPWADEMVQRNASVAILNTGAFHQPHPIFLKRLNFTLRLLRDKLPHLLIVYRSTSSAHLACTAFKEPLTIPRSICGAPYHWGEFETQNKLARRLVEDVGGVWLDVFTMTSLRPDWHLHKGDCLHYCAPGPIDSWLTLLTNMLMELA